MQKIPPFFASPPAPLHKEKGEDDGYEKAGIMDIFPVLYAAKLPNYLIISVGGTP
jgi:hypothetical protein